ncbi:helix-turn-helix transcriptional regulator [Lacrimispora brassicae]
MKDYNVHLTLIDRIILDSYKIMLEGLADYLGGGYEMVLHSLEDTEHSVIKIINGHHTGRTEGMPITDLALQMLEEIEKDGEKSYISYFTKNKKEEPLKSSTIVVRGEEGRIIGLLCINFYLNTGLAEILSSYFPQTSTHSLIKTETFANNLDELIFSKVQKVRKTVMEDDEILPSLKNKEIINSLHQQGVFTLKDAVIKVADYLGISKNTVYMHIRNAGVNTDKKNE